MRWRKKKLPDIPPEKKRDAVQENLVLIMEQCGYEDVKFYSTHVMISKLHREVPGLDIRTTDFSDENIERTMEMILQHRSKISIEKSRRETVAWTYFQMLYRMFDPTFQSTGEEAFSYDTVYPMMCEFFREKKESEEMEVSELEKFGRKEVFDYMYQQFRYFFKKHIRYLDPPLNYDGNIDLVKLNEFRDLLNLDRVY